MKSAKMSLAEFERSNIVVEFQVPWYDDTLFLVPTPTVGRTLKVPRGRALTVAELRPILETGDKALARAAFEAKLTLQGQVTGSRPNTGKEITREAVQPPLFSLDAP